MFNVELSNEQVLYFEKFQVQLLYNDENLDVDVQFLIKRLEILQTDPPNLERSYNIDKYLASFCKVEFLKQRTAASFFFVCI